MNISSIHEFSNFIMFYYFTTLKTLYSQNYKNQASFEYIASFVLCFLVYVCLTTSGWFSLNHLVIVDRTCNYGPLDLWFVMDEKRTFKMHS